MACEYKRYFNSSLDNLDVETFSCDYIKENYDKMLQHLRLRNKTDFLNRVDRQYESFKNDLDEIIRECTCHQK